MVKYFKTLFIVLFAAVLFAGNLQAADNITSKNSIDFNKINKKLEQIDDNLKKENLTEDNINTYVSYLSDQEAQISATRKDLDKDIKYIQKQLDALGEPKEGATEDKVITKQRNDLTKQLTAEDRVLKEADLLIVKIEDLTTQVLNARSKRVYGDLITKQSALINPMVFFNSLKLYAIFFWDIAKSPIDW